MRGFPEEPRLIGEIPLVGHDRPHAGRLDDEHHTRLRQGPTKFGNDARHPEAAQFLIIGKRKVNRNRRRFRIEPFGEGQRTGDRPLHVTCAAPVQTIATPRQFERRTRPVRGVCRNHVRMAREHQPAVPHRTEGGEKIRLPSVRRRENGGGRAKLGKQGVHPGDELHVRPVRRGVERDQLLEDADGRGEMFFWHVHGHFTRRPIADCPGRARSCRYRHSHPKPPARQSFP